MYRKTSFGIKTFFRKTLLSAVDLLFLVIILFSGITNFSCSFSDEDALQVLFTSGDPVFVAMRSDGFVYRTDDPRDWNQFTSSIPGFSPQKITYGNGKLVAVGQVGANRATFLSADGMVWAPGDNTNTGQPGGVYYGNGIFVITGVPRRIYLSSDGINPMLVYDGGGTEGFISAAYGNDRFVVVGDRFTLNSSDGYNWVLKNLPLDTIFDVVYAQNKFIAVGGNFSATATLIYSSINGINWSGNLISGTGNTLVGVAYGNRRFVAVGLSPSVFVSENGDDWGEYPNPAGGGITFRDIAFGYPYFVAVADGGTIMISEDGISWEIVANVGGDLYGVAVLP